jgi:hypothetical protein
LVGVAKEAESGEEELRVWCEEEGSVGRSEIEERWGDWERKGSTSETWRVWNTCIHTCNDLAGLLDDI